MNSRLLGLPAPLFAACAAALLIRLLVLLIFGPLHAPDTGIYLRQAAGLAEYFSGHPAPANYSAFKGTGFGLVVLVFQTAFGENWTWSLVICQIAASFAASLLVAWFFLVLTNRPRLGSVDIHHRGSRAVCLQTLAALLFLAHNLSLPMAVDQWLLRDSLFSSGLTIVLVTIALFGARRRRLPLPAAVGLGIILAGCFVLREQIIYYGIFFLPLLILSLRRGGSGWPRIALVALLLMVPIAGARQGIIMVNEDLAGQAVVSTNARSVMLQALLEVAEQHPELFDGETALDQIARAEFDDYTFAEVLIVKDKLVKDAGVSEEDAVTMTIAKYFEAWRRFPGTFAGAVFERVMDDQPKLLFSPGSALMMHALYATDDPLYASSRRTLAAGLATRDYRKVLIAATELVGEPFSVALYILACGGLLVAFYGFLTGRTILPEQSLLLCCFVAYGGLLLAHAMVHVEPRHVAGVIWVPQVVSFISLDALITAWRKRRRNDSKKH